MFEKSLPTSDALFPNSRSKLTKQMSNFNKILFNFSVLLTNFQEKHEKIFVVVWTFNAANFSHFLSFSLIFWENFHWRLDAAWMHQWFFCFSRNPIHSCWCLGKTDNRVFSLSIEALRLTSSCGSANSSSSSAFYSPWDCTPCLCVCVKSDGLQCGW